MNGILGKKFRYEGTWWYPDDLNNKIHGTITFDDSEGALLSLDGFLENDKGEKRFEPDIILGETSGQKITLYECTFLHVYSMTSSTVQANWILLGEHFSKPNNITFSRILVNYSNIEKLFKKIDFWKTLLMQKTELANGSLKLSTAIIPRNCEIGFILNSNTERCNPQQIVDYSDRNVWIQIQALVDKSFKNYSILKGHMLDFLNFVLPVEVKINSIIGVVEENMNTTEISMKTVEIFYRSPITKIYKDTRGDRLFTYSKALDKLNELLIKWFSIIERLKPVYDLYFGAIYNPEIYIEFQFLGYAQACEVYHRSTMDHENPEKVKRASDIQIIKSRCPEYASWLSEIFATSFSMSFLERIDELFTKYQEIASVYFKFKRKKSFLSAVKNTRNYYTHYTKSLKNKIPQDDDFFWLTMDIRLMLRLCLLTELGYSIDTLNDAFYTRKLQHLKG